MSQAQDLFRAPDAGLTQSLPAISLWQPWASATMLPDLKPTETRHWLPPRHLIGRRVAIHAAARPVAGDLDIRVVRALAEAFGPDWRAKLPRGAVVGTAVLLWARSMRDVRPAHANDEAFGHWAADRFAWRLAEPVALPTPLPCKGRQAWFTVGLPKALT